jgi:hypothetical protein
MAILYANNGNFGGNPNMMTFILAAQPPAIAGGPMPTGLGGVPTTWLTTGLSAAQNIGIVAGKTVAVGLSSCASVIYASTDPAANAIIWVHHVNAGAVTAAHVNQARLQLGNPPWATIFVVYGHAGIQDPGYLAAIKVIQNQGIPANNIVEIPQLVNLGVNNLGQLGF